MLMDIDFNACVFQSLLSSQLLWFRKLLALPDIKNETRTLLKNICNELRKSVILVMLKCIFIVLMILISREDIKNLAIFWGIVYVKHVLTSCRSPLYFYLYCLSEIAAEKSLEKIISFVPGLCFISHLTL